jgi:hypothetical protein
MSGAHRSRRSFGAVGGGMLAFIAATSIAIPDARARGKACVETSDIVGYQRCRTYGQGWASEGWPALTASLGYALVETSMAGAHFDAKVGRSQPTLYSFDGAPTDGTAVGHGMSFRVGGYVWGPIYLGLQSDFFAGRYGRGPVGVSGYAVTSADGLDLFGGSFGAYGGLRLPLGPLSLRAEGYAGARILNLSQKALGSDGVGHSTNATTLIGVFEPRAVLDVWVSPRLTLTAYAGFDLPTGSVRSFGLTFEGHLRAFDGAYTM